MYYYLDVKHSRAMKSNLYVFFESTRDNPLCV